METYNIKFVAHLTDNFQMKSAEELIKKLKTEIGQDNSYIEELEETNASLKATIEAQNLKLIEQEKAINKTASEIIDERVEKRNQRIKLLEAEVESLKTVRDKLISELNKVRG